MEKGADKYTELVRDFRVYLSYLQDLGIEGLAMNSLNGLTVDEEGKVEALEKRGGELTLEDIRKDLGVCTRCKLHTHRTNIVFGAGDCRAKLVFVGEGPGRDEDIQGLPFVGAAGRMLTNIIERVLDTKREKVYIANIIK